MIAIIKSSGANFLSIISCLKSMNAEVVLTENQELIKKASHVILPGVGSADFAMQRLMNKQLDQLIPKLTQPVLGICLGMQLMAEYSEEGRIKTLNIFSGSVKKLTGKIVPHMGWNNLRVCKKTELLSGITEQDDFYFVHSYALSLNKHCCASCDYETPFSAVIKKNNFYGVQFHPEKSSRSGKLILQNFLRL